MPFDSTVRHGYVRVLPSGEIRLTHETWLVLQNEGSSEEVGAYVMAQTEPGDYLIPMSLMRYGEAQDLQRGLSMVDPEPSTVCIYPPCLLPSTVVHGEGFPLCEEHAQLLQSWDDLATF